ncbi:MAG TPA: SpoIIE family protein phosphatase [Thermoleophilaceae bacterium]|nr:SpoIIE family protein phosphatase [Thermoleophilaceae bacterium]
MPDLFDRRIRARSLAYVSSAGAVVAVLTLVLPHGASVRELPLLVAAIAALIVAGLVYLRAERIGEWQLHSALVAGVVLLTVANYAVGSSALYPILYSWAALYAFYFFPLRVGLAYLGLIGLCYGVLLGIENPPSPVVRWILTVGTPGVAGALISFLLRRLRAEVEHSTGRARAVIEGERRTRQILQSARDAFISIDPEGVVTAWNAAAERMFGWRAEEAIGRPLAELVYAPEDYPAYDERRTRLLKAPEAQSQRFEVEYQRRGGERFPAELTAWRVTVGEEVFLSAFIRDLSERRRLQREQEVRIREQTARAEAERVAEMVSGMQLLVDAALVHRRLEEILADLLPRVRAVMDAAAVSVFLTQDDDEEHLVLRASTGGPVTASSPVPFGRGFAGRVAAERRPLSVQRPSPEDRLDPGLEGIEIESLIGVPLTAEGTVRGVIQVAAVAPRRFAAEDLDMLRLAADRVALAIEHARVYEREHRIAESLQRSLLPERLPQLPGLAVAARYRPAASEAEVGGDWYDVIPLPAGPVGLVMGDVAGKGLAAASMVGRLRSALRAYALEGHDPPSVVERLNRLVWTEHGDSEMTTLVYALVDPAAGTVRWVNAGHPPPLVIEPPGGARYLEDGRSVPLGVLPFPTYEERGTALGPGGTVILYTDGLIERPGAHLDEGLAYLAERLRDAPAEPEGLCDHLLRSMVPGHGAPDDVALLALQNTPMADRFTIALPAEPEALASMRALLRRWLRAAEGTEQEVAEIITACGEAATNAIEHAAAPGSRPFEVKGLVNGREVEITVRDHGAWRVPRDGDQGRGLALMRALMDAVEVTPSPEGTIVRLRRVLGGRGPE